LQKCGLFPFLEKKIIDVYLFAFFPMRESIQSIFLENQRRPIRMEISRSAKNNVDEDFNDYFANAAIISKFL
jgi:hypothetical protein